MDPSSSRYHGKPILRLLECYTLWAINELPEREATLLVEMTPKLRAIYHAQGDWQQVVAAAVELPREMPSLIRDLWAKNLEIARQTSVTLTPQQFAEMFVDENLVN